MWIEQIWLVLCFARETKLTQLGYRAPPWAGWMGLEGLPHGTVHGRTLEKELLWEGPSKRCCSLWGCCWAGQTVASGPPQKA